LNNTLSIDGSVKPFGKIFILYPYYWPHFKAGGPTQSLYNLVSLFSHKVNFFIISLDRDIDGVLPTIEIQSRKWVSGPNGEQIFFTPRITIPLVLSLIYQIKPSNVYINGIFNFQTTISGLISHVLFGHNTIISPRGMLQSWALKKKGRKKRIYLFFIRFLLNKKLGWHATDINESNDIIKVFKSAGSIFIAPNVPRKVSAFKEQESPIGAKIRLVFLSLINSNKNLHLVINAVNENAQFTLDIFGPIADEKYWDFCRKSIKNQRIVYRGSIPAWTVPATLKKYHFFVLPTLGENFGHAIFDALASSLPVITTTHTPWQDIEKKKCGFYIDLAKSDSLSAVLKTIISISNEEYQSYRLNSYNYAETYWQQNDYYSHYKFLIG